MLQTIFYKLSPETAAALPAIKTIRLLPLSGDAGGWTSQFQKALQAEALVLTDEQACIDWVRADWDAMGEHTTEIYPVIGVEQEGIQLSGCNYVVDSAETLDEEFFERIYRRVHRLPWTVIETARCVLRETTQEDLERLYEIYEDSDMKAFMDPLYPEKAREAAYLKEYQDKIYAFYGFGVWSVVEKEQGLVIGRAGISMREGYEEPELGFCMDRNFRRQGYAREVCQAILHFMKEEYEIPSVQALVRPGNTASEGLLEQLGFRAQESVLVDGRMHRRFLFPGKNLPC